MNTGNFFAELKRRNVYKVAVAYAVVGWLLVQVTTQVFPIFEIPNWALRLIVLAIIIGFPIALVMAWAFELTPEGIKRTEDVDLAQMPTKSRTWIYIAVVGSVVSIGLFFLGRYVVGSKTTPRHDGSPARTEAATASLSEKSIAATDTGPHVIRSLAVLPLDNYSGDKSQDYFAEGMTDELTTDLATISQLRVISRSSTTQFTGAQRPPTPEIAKMLNVDAVVEGSVRRAGDKVRISAQLIDARADRHLWAKSFERDSRDVLALQSELASAIASEINVQLTPSEQVRLTSARSVNPEAYDAYLKGRYFFNRPSDQNLSKAITQFEDAVRLDPGFTPAYSGLSDAYLWAAFNEGAITAAEGKVKAKDAAEKALALNPASAEAHTSLANYKSWYGHDWAGADREFRQAIALNPNYAFAHDQFALTLACQGRFDESVAEGQRAAELDPLDPVIAIDNTLAFAGQGEFQKAKDEARRGVQLDPTFFFPQMQFGWIDLQQGNVRAAIPKLKEAAAMESPPFATAWLGYAYGAAGDRMPALATIEELKEKSPNGVVAPFNLALVHLGLGELDRAMDYLEQASAVDSQWMMYLKVDRAFDPLRSNPRFTALMEKCHFEK
jgi:TolB-like protein/Tfp pilus assembly protein PilF